MGASRCGRLIVGRFVGETAAGLNFPASTLTLLPDGAELPPMPPPQLERPAAIPHYAILDD